MSFRPPGDFLCDHSSWPPILACQSYPHPVMSLFGIELDWLLQPLLHICCCLSSWHAYLHGCSLSSRKSTASETMDTDDPEHCYLDFQIQNDPIHTDPSRLLFMASTTSDTLIVIKFTHWYCAELHALCAKLSHAPQLLAFEHLPGGWYGVTMGYILTAVPLWLFQRTMSSAHAGSRSYKKYEENLVHGDLRDMNIIIKKDEQVLLVDFDWRGKDGKTVYPWWDLNLELQDGRTHNDLRIQKEDNERILAYAFSKSSSWLLSCLWGTWLSCSYFNLVLLVSLVWVGFYSWLIIDVGK